MQQRRIATFQDHLSGLARTTVELVSDCARASDAKVWFKFGTLRWIVAGLFVLLALQWVGSERAGADCRATPFAFQPGAQSDVAMRVAHGRSCALAARTGSAVVEDVTTFSPPQHGSLQRRGRTGVVYRPAPGHRGDDFFVISLNGRRDGEAGPMLVRIKVDVR